MLYLCLQILSRKIKFTRINTIHNIIFTNKSSKRHKIRVMNININFIRQSLNLFLIVDESDEAY